MKGHMGKGKMQNEDTKYTETYQTIITTAKRLFMEFGYRAVSTRQIAQICGVTQPAIYHHFKNKQTLYVAILRQTLLQTESDLKKILSQFTTFQDRFSQLAIYMMLHFELDMSQMFHDISHELSPEDQKLIHQCWVNGFLLPVKTMINDGVSGKEIQDFEKLKMNATELAYLLLNIIKSILQPATNSVQLAVVERETLVKEKAKLVVEIIINGIKA
jgi:AcrR family transcriptional regulator